MSLPISDDFENNQDKISDFNNDQPVNYEKAVSLVGFGKYNYRLILLCIPCTIAPIFANSSMSYVLSQAQCDLNLTLQNKGVLNAVPYIGIICSGLFWGLAADRYGRRVILICAFALDALSNLVASMSSTYYMLVTTKYFSGFMIAAPIATVLTYMSEFHHFSFRPKLITIFGLYYSIAKIMLPLLAWLLLPLHIDVSLVKGIIEFKSWQIFLLTCCLPSLISSIIFFTFTESPKFLMTKGKYKEALLVFKKMYLHNSGKSDSFPFTRVIDTIYEEQKTKAFEGTQKSSEFHFFRIWHLLKPLFTPANLYKLCITASISFSSLLGSITLRLWLPQLLATMDEYTQTHNKTNAVLCEMLDFSPKNKTNNLTCTVPNLSTSAYLNNLIVPVFAIISYFIIGFIVNKVGKKNILIILPVIAGITILANYFSRNSLTTVLLSSAFLALDGVVSTVCSSVTIELFPTSLRAKALSLVTICGRFGPLVGNIAFPALLSLGCLYPFIFMACFAFFCTFVSLLLPQTEKMALV